MDMTKSEMTVRLNILKEYSRDNEDWDKLKEDCAIEISEISKKLFRDKNETRDYLQNNIFYDSKTQKLLKFISKMNIDKKFVGEHYHGFVMIENPMMVPLINVNVNMTFSRDFTNPKPRKETHVLISDRAIPNFQPLQAAMLPFSFYLMEGKHEFAKQNPDQNELL